MATERVNVAPDMLRWAVDRSGRGEKAARESIPQLTGWLAGETRPTLRQFKEFAKWTRTPAPLLLLSAPPTVELPIADFRAGRGIPKAIPSPELLDTVHLCQNRQAWFEDYTEEFGMPVFSGARFVLPLSVTDAAVQLRDELIYQVSNRSRLKEAGRARRYLIDRFEELGGLTVINGIVGNNSSRKLDTDEFRGFTLNSTIAPLVFINGADNKYGQIFSLAHEFAHVWRGDSGVSAESILEPSANETERWCNSVAAEFLVPSEDLLRQNVSQETFDEDLDRLNRRYLCSTMMLIIRLRELRVLDPEFLSRMYGRQLRRLRNIPPAESTGGNFQSMQTYRIGPRFSESIFQDTASGRTSVTEAIRLTGLKRTTLEKFLPGPQAA